MVFDNYQVAAEPSALPTILLAPASQAVTAGARVVLGVVVSGNSSLEYQWLRNGVEIAGENGLVLTLDNITTAQSGNYSVRVSSFAGSSVSTAGVITVGNANSAPAFAGVGNRLVHAGTLLSFTAAATDADLPGQSLTFSLAPGAPTGATITPATGAFTWTPSTSQIGQTYPVSVVVADNGAPSLTAVTSFNVNVGPPLAINSVQRSGNQLTLTWASLAGKIYQVQSNPGLDAAWTDLGPPRTAVATSLSASDIITPSTTPRRFYRVSTTN
jgi:hypothetical protein